MCHSSPFPSLTILRRQFKHPTKQIAFLRTRLILYLIIFFVSLLSSVFYIAAISHFAALLASGSASLPYSVYENVHPLIGVALIPLLWSALWSFIVLRTLLIAINQPSSSEHFTENSNNEDNNFSFPPNRPPPLPSRPSRHRSSRCCCCTCTPWFPTATGPHPVFTLVIEVLLPPILGGLGFSFGIFFTHLYSYALTYYASNYCPAYTYEDPSKLEFECSSGYPQVIGLESVAVLSLIFCSIAHLVALVVACVSVHHWRGRMGKRRGPRAKRVDRGSGIGEV
jgi:hypothetical protein